jgi:hypothetical protein
VEEQGCDLAWSLGKLVSIAVDHGISGRAPSGKVVVLESCRKTAAEEA